MKGRARARLRRISLRWRITIAFLGGALAVSALVAGTTYVLADRYLTGQRVEAAMQQTFSHTRFAARFLADPEPDLGDLVDALESRGDLDALIIQGDDFISRPSVAPASIPAGLREPVLEGRVGYAFLDEPPTLVFGSPVPRQEIALFLFYPLEALTDSLRVLRNVLLAVPAAAVLIAALVGTRVSRRVVDPVRRASAAARRVAEGLLETRLPVAGGDELGALAHSFNEMAAALEERIARERRFAGDVSHELRTPLTTLRTSTDYLLKHLGDLPPSARRATELMAADLAYLQRLVEDLLEISGAESGRAPMSWERLNLADLAREVVDRRVRTGGDVRVFVRGERTALATIADKRRLERVVSNLLDNALVHGQGRDVTVRVAAEGRALLLSVEDLGPGIPSDALSRVFDRFFKADPARQRSDGRGSGLGLAIARENAHLHDGEIEVQSVHGRGARFTLRLPRREREPSEAAQQEEVEV